MVTSTKKVTNKGIGSGGNFPGPNGKKPGGNGFHGGGSEDPSKRKFSPAAYRITMWMVLAAIVMMFGALSVAYAYVMVSEEQRSPVPMPRMFFVSTALILVSSATFQRAKRSLQQDRARAYLRWLLVTLGLGIAFVVSQLVGWRELSRAGVYFSGHPRSTFFYLATALHGGHLLGGIGLVFYLVMRRLRPLWPLHAEKNTAWTRVVGLYWHAMDGIWIWLFALLLIFK
ncbi:MAG TPA: cytochrome c oxidase subunit 3 [Pyrinomonadaceae bacterium]|jgi:cytochrome c oxidase subunit 3|nr:cytochrome c oxidase subunit 3 [Pyrinomonadaceae bacterium]